MGHDIRDHSMSVMSSCFPKDEALEKKDRMDEMKLINKNSSCFLFSLSSCLTMMAGVGVAHKLQLKWTVAKTNLWQSHHS